MLGKIVHCTTSVADVGYFRSTYAGPEYGPEVDREERACAQGKDLWPCRGC